MWYTSQTSQHTHTQLKHQGNCSICCTNVLSLVRKRDIQSTNESSEPGHWNCRTNITREICMLEIFMQTQHKKARVSSSVSVRLLCSAFLCVRIAVARTQHETQHKQTAHARARGKCTPLRANMLHTQPDYPQHNTHTESREYPIAVMHNIASPMARLLPHLHSRTYAWLLCIVYVCASAVAQMQQNTRVALHWGEVYSKFDIC